MANYNSAPRALRWAEDARDERQRVSKSVQKSLAHAFRAVRDGGGAEMAAPGYSTDEARVADWLHT